jgi:two-component system sensor histidine kinase DegS
VSVSLEEQNRKILLVVKDDGKGITKEEIASSQAFGLIGMRERVQFLGGEVMITGDPNAGTTVSVMLPIDSDQKQNPGATT